MTLMECRWPACKESEYDYGVPLCQSHISFVISYVNTEADHWRGVMTRPIRPRPPSTRPEPDRLVYYARLHNGRIKIGSTGDLATRMSALRVDRADVLASEPGGYTRERERHIQFASLRIGRTEDFTDAAGLREHVDTIREAFGDPWQMQDAMMDWNRRKTA